LRKVRAAHPRPKWAGFLARRCGRAPAPWSTPGPRLFKLWSGRQFAVEAACAERVGLDGATQSVEELQNVIIGNPRNGSFPPSPFFQVMTMPDPVAIAPGARGLDGEFAWISGSSIRWRQ
jgi:hypothetical protein